MPQDEEAMTSILRLLEQYQQQIATSTDFSLKSTTFLSLRHDLLALVQRMANEENDVVDAMADPIDPATKAWLDMELNMAHHSPRNSRNASVVSAASSRVV
jgi:hypothetical protein